jgi:hypothetical protein
MQVSIHVDDFSLSVEADSEDLALERLEEAADHMNGALEGLQMKQAKDKEEILATSDSLALRAARMLQISNGRVPNRAVKLGADYSIRNKGPAKKVRQKARMNKFKARLSIATRMLGRNQRAFAKVVRTGLMPGALYAAELTDFSKTDVNYLRSASLRSAGMNFGGVHNDLKWAVLGANLDPEVAIMLAPVLAFSRECWANGFRGIPEFEIPHDGLSGLELWQVQQEVSQLMADPRTEASDWANLSRLAKALTFFGCRFSGPGHMKLRCGKELDLSICSPRLLEGLLTDGHDRFLAEVAHQRIWDAEGELDTDVLRRSVRLGGHSRAFVTKAIAGKLYTRERASVFGAVEDGNCEVCPGGLLDTQEHRVLQCVGPSTSKVCPKGTKGWKSLQESGIRNIPHRGCSGVKKAHVRLMPSIDEFDYFIDGQRSGVFQFEEGHPIYIDGSGMHGKNPDIRSAASAAVQLVSEQDSSWRVLSSAVPDVIDQTSVVAEIFALFMVIRHLKPGVPYIIYADCMAVILGFRKRFADLKGKGRHDGLWKQIFEARKGLTIVLRKTKAHRTRTQAAAEGDLVNFAGNDCADLEAKKSAGRYGFPPAVCEEAENIQHARRRGTEWTLARLKEAAVNLPKVPLRKKGSRRARRAEWEGAGCLLFKSKTDGLVCRMCFSRSTARRKKVKICQGLNSAARQVAQHGNAKGHSMMVGRQLGGALDGAPMFMCKACGAYATAKCVSIKLPCPNLWGGRRTGFNRFMSGKHPCLPKVLVEGQRPVSETDLQVGLGSCKEHNDVWKGASFGARGRREGLRSGLHLDGGSSGDVEPSDRSCGQVGHRSPDRLGAPPSAEVEAEWGGGELDASELDAFFGPT